MLIFFQELRHSYGYLLTINTSQEASLVISLGLETMVICTRMKALGSSQILGQNDYLFLQKLAGADSIEVTGALDKGM